MLTATRTRLGQDEENPLDFLTSEELLNFDCVLGVCRGKGVAADYGQNLQKAINRFGTLTGKYVDEDNVITALTVEAVRAIAGNTQVMSKISDDTYSNLLSATENSIALAGDAKYVIDALTATADKLGLPAVAVVPGGVKTAAKSAGTEGTSIWWYVLAAVAVLGVGTVGYLIYRRRSAAIVTA